MFPVVTSVSDRDSDSSIILVVSIVKPVSVDNSSICTPSSSPAAVTIAYVLPWIVNVSTPLAFSSSNEPLSVSEDTATMFVGSLTSII